MKKTIFAVAIIVLFLIAGCEQTTNEKSDVNKPFLGGTVGLEMKFTQEAPPLEVFDNTNNLYKFDVSVRAENNGEWDVKKEDTQFTLKGIDVLKDFGLTTSVKSSETDLTGLDKDSQGNIVQGNNIAYIEFKDLAYQRKVTGTLQLPLWAEACYKYGTKAQTKLCINKELLRNEEAKVCEVNEEKTVENSGAPLHVESFKESASATDQITFTFDIRHLGIGAIYKDGTKCGANAVRENENKVKVTVNTGMGNAGDLKCLGLRDEKSEAGKFFGYTTIYEENKRSVTCTQKIDKRDDYTKAIDITLEYDYKEHIETTLLVKHSD